VQRRPQQRIIPAEPSGLRGTARAALGALCPAYLPPASRAEPRTLPAATAAPPGQQASGRLADSAGGPRLRLLLAARSAALLAACLFVVLQPGVPTLPRHLCYALAICAFVTLLMDLPAAALGGALGLEFIPSFDAPWLSASLAEFWGRRWNIPTASMLRCVVGGWG
jgi:hypothetical protein